MNLNKINEFLTFYQTLEGYEKGESQTFLNRLFQVFGYKDCHEAGGQFEKRTKVDKQTKFEDLLIPNKVLVEMKSRGKDLQSASYQAREYWNNSYGADKTQYVVICNFDEFWIFDWNKQNAPLDKLETKELSLRWRSLAFLSKEKIEPQFANNVEKVTKQAVEMLLKIYHSLDERIEDKNSVRKYILQLLICLFSEDIGLFPRMGYFLDIIHDCMDKNLSTYDLFTGLFQQMNTKLEAKGGRFKGVRYFNGGIFKDIIPIELNKNELDLLELCARFDWSKVEPAIFGNIFENSMHKIERHAMGAHYTYEKDIMKIIRPTIVNPILDKIKKSKSIDELTKIRKELGKLRILDPACGSGNFLYIALREMKNLEIQILSKIQDMSSRKKNLKDEYSIIQLKQFHGMDINPFAVELAKVTLSFGKKIFNDQFLNYIQSQSPTLEIVDRTLPFDDLDNNIFATDALFVDWMDADIIIGNPPFLGGKYLREQRGDEYAEKIYQRFPDAKGQPDYCVFWFQKAQDNTAKRVGLVGTNSISQMTSRKQSLDYILSKGGILVNAVSTQEWSGEANVHVSLVNWIKDKKDCPNSLYLDDKKVSQINSSLKAEKNYTNVKRIPATLKKSFEGCQLAGKGFIISQETAEEWILLDKKNENVLVPMIDGKTLVSPYMKLDWVIDFNDRTLEDASKYKLPFEHVKRTVKPERDNNNRKARKVYWWQFGEKRPGMRKAIEGLKFYFCLPKIAKYTCFRVIDVSILPCEANMVIASDDFYILGVLNSKIHLDWVKAQSSTLKADTRYTNTTCFETFPFSVEQKQRGEQTVSEEQTFLSVRTIMTELESFRTKECIERKCSITSFYNEFINEPSSKLFSLHKKLNKAVCESYGWKYVEGKSYNDELLELNEKLGV